MCIEDNDKSFSSVSDQAQFEVHLRQLKASGINSVCFTPTASQDDPNRPVISFAGQLEPRMEREIKAAKRYDFKVVMVPQILIPATAGTGASWRSAIHMRSEEEWRRWFTDYERVIAQFAAIAQDLRVDLFMIGSGYDKATADRDREWRRIINSVRAIYRGPISYQANGLEEAQRIYFWDALDLIAIREDIGSDLSLMHSKSEFGLFTRRHGNKRLLTFTDQSFVSDDMP